MFGVCGAQRAVQTGLDQAQVNVGITAFGHRDLGGFGPAYQGVPKPIAHHFHQTLVVHRVAVKVGHAAQFRHALRLVHGVDQVPGGQVKVHAAGHGARCLPRNAQAKSAIAQGGHHAGQRHPAVKVGAGNVHAVVGQNVAAAVQPAHPLRSHAHHGKV